MIPYFRTPAPYVTLAFFLLSLYREPIRQLLEVPPKKLLGSWNSVRLALYRQRVELLNIAHDDLAKFLAVLAYNAGTTGIGTLFALATIYIKVLIDTQHILIRDAAVMHFLSWLLGTMASFGAGISFSGVILFYQLARGVVRYPESVEILERKIFKITGERQEPGSVADKT